jgi:hypothetical protein
MTSDNLRQDHEMPANEQVCHPQKAPHNPKVAASNPAPAMRKAVEPTDVVVWIRRDDADLWADELMATPARPSAGRVTAQLTPDPFVLSLASKRAGIQVADPVQLYLDCRAAGERALEAADAIRAEMQS